MTGTDQDHVRGFSALLQAFGDGATHQGTKGSRVALHLLRQDLHDTWRFAYANPDKISRDT